MPVTSCMTTWKCGNPVLCGSTTRQYRSLASLCLRTRLSQRVTSSPSTLARSANCSDGLRSAHFVPRSLSLLAATARAMKWLCGEQVRVPNHVRPGWAVNSALIRSRQWEARALRQFGHFLHRTHRSMNADCVTDDARSLTFARNICAGLTSRRVVSTPRISRKTGRRQLPAASHSTVRGDFITPPDDRARSAKPRKLCIWCSLRLTGLAPVSLVRW